MTPSQAPKPSVVAPMPASSAPPFQLVSAGLAAKYYKGMVYAEPGVGKTYLTGTFADVLPCRDMLLLSAEGGDMTLDTDEHDFTYVDALRVTNWKMLNAVYGFLKLHCELRDKLARGENHFTNPAGAKIGVEEELWRIQRRLTEGLPEGAWRDPNRLRQYRSLGIDSLTEIEAYCQYDLTGTNHLTSDIAAEAAEFGWGEFRKQLQMVQRVIRAMRDLPMHVMFTCHAALKEDKAAKTAKWGPQLSGQLRDQAQGFVDMVGYYVRSPIDPGQEESTVTRRMYIEPGPKHMAKNRFSRFKKNYFDNPTMPIILTSIGLVELKDCPRLAAEQSSKQKAATTKG